MTNRVFPVLAALAVLAGCGSSSSSTKSKATTPGPAPAAAATSAKVAIANFKFVPPAVMLKRGGRITFTNQDTTEHTATADDGSSFDSGALNRGQSKTVTFAKAGTFSYHCAFHPFMKATVVVVA